MTNYQHTITIVGCGPGHPQYLTPAATTAAEEAETVVGAQRLLDLFPNISAQKIIMSGPLTDTLDAIEEQAAAGQRVAVLVTGDPGIRSLARPVIDRIGRQNCRIIPGISSVQVAFAAVGCAWENVRIVSAHHRMPSVTPQELSQHDRIAVLLGADNAVDWTARVAEALPSHRCFVCEHLTLPEERVREVGGESLRTLNPAGRAVILFINRETMT